MAEIVYYVDTDVVGGAGDGSSWSNAYASLNAAETARDGDIATAGNTVTFLCRGATNADTAAVNINGWTTDADSYVKIEADPEDRHAGVWSTSKYRISIADALAFQIGEDYVTVDGLQIETSSANQAGQVPIIVNAQAATNNAVIISNCIVKGHNSGTYTQSGILFGDADTISYVFNCIIYNINTLSGSRGITGQGATQSIYNCTVIGGEYGIRSSAATCNMKNCYLGGSGVEAYLRNVGTLNKNYCASSDGSADDTGANETTDANYIINVALDNDTFVDSTGNFHLAADGLSPLQGEGAAPGGAAPLDYTTDIDGETITTWSIGADSIVAGGVDVSVGSASLTKTTYDASIKANVSFTADSSALTLNTYVAVINAAHNVRALQASLTATPYACTPNAAINVSAASKSLSIGVNAATVNAGIDISAASGVLNLTSNTAGINAAINIAALAASLSVTTYAASLNAGTDVAASCASLTITPNACLVNAAKNILAATKTFSLTEYSAGINAETNIGASSTGLSILPNAADVNLNVGISAAYPSLNLQSYGASIKADINIQTLLKELIVSIYEPSVQVGSISLLPESPISFATKESDQCLAERAKYYGAELSSLRRVIGRI